MGSCFYTKDLTSLRSLKNLACHGTATEDLIAPSTRSLLYYPMSRPGPILAPSPQAG